MCNHHDPDQPENQSSPIRGISAPYSVEDNKLRLYALYRLDEETFARVKQAGFKLAPKQNLFGAPKWTSAREDLCLDPAREIEPEETTLAGRAEQKADKHKRVETLEVLPDSTFSTARVNTKIIRIEEC